MVEQSGTGVLAGGRELFRRYWVRGKPGRPTSQVELTWIFGAWLLAFVGKVLGSSWDVSWHFKWLRDDLAPPHLLNSLGTGLVFALVVFHSYTGFGVDKIALRLMQWGIGLFLLAVPLDLLNHAIHGLDITSWSPTHVLLYSGTAVMLTGTIRAWWLYAAPGRIRNVVLLALWMFFFENVLFPNQHQEYGVVSLGLFNQGRTSAEPILLDFAREQGSSPAEFMLPVPSWVHPAWLICAGFLTLVVARKVTGLRWTATMVTAGYLLYRFITMGLLGAADFPTSAVPVMALVGAVLIDLAVTFRVPALVAGLVVSFATYGAAWLQETVWVIPPWSWWSALPVALGFALLWFGVNRIPRAKSDDPVSTRYPASVAGPVPYGTGGPDKNPARASADSPPASVAGRVRYGTGGPDKNPARASARTPADAPLPRSII
ncbi:MAG: hypothetical protein M3400_08975 [Actinomycetota bacterium]|nr:hypothetical protein [Actinomycetota bacterium]